MTSEETPAFGQAEENSHRNHDAGPVSYRVIKTVAAESNTAVSELEPLYYSIDPDALDSLFSTQSVQSITRVSFAFSDYQVTVEGDGSISVTAPDESRAEADEDD